MTRSLIAVHPQQAEHSSWRGEARHLRTSRSVRGCPRLGAFVLPASEDLRQEYAVPQVRSGLVGEPLLDAGGPRHDERREEGRQHEDHVVAEARDVRDVASGPVTSLPVRRPYQP
jgi:hypothetical protein